ncbi:biliverdin-producing heme oxygenase [Ensifer sp.]|jgi:heme oxygenase|uniref:biliverdin-producing heme oxygenase n=1 Tax=Ensifer sp. TaxID=1872086 RepID=UPI002E131D0C|nr:biliverdin-producing heme oxygenase [Ensifer sp.]
MRGNEQRFELRSRTREGHQQVDAAVGSFSTLEDYRRYVERLLPFRLAMDQALKEAVWPEGWNWRPCGVTDTLAMDATDLGLSPRRHPQADLDLSDPSGLLGALYVLEGSTLGARVLSQRASALGLDETYGARHLVLMSNDTSRWPAFLTLLEQARDFDIERAAFVANAVFALALQCFEGDTVVAH